MLTLSLSEVRQEKNLGILVFHRKYYPFYLFSFKKIILPAVECGVFPRFFIVLFNMKVSIERPYNSRDS
jgi:hypothetical protein